MSKNKFLDKNKNWEAFSKEETPEGKYSNQDLSDKINDFIKLKKDQPFLKSTFTGSKELNKKINQLVFDLFQRKEFKKGFKEISKKTWPCQQTGSVEDLVKKIKNDQLKVLSSCYGKINHILVTYPKSLNNFSTDHYHKERLEQLFSELCKGIDHFKVTILTNKDPKGTKQLQATWKAGQFQQINFQSPITTEGFYNKENLSLFNEEFKKLIFPTLIKELNVTAFDIDASVPDFHEIVKIFMPDPLSIWVQDFAVTLGNSSKSVKTCLLEPEPIKLLPSRHGMKEIANMFKCHFYQADNIEVYERFQWQIQGGNLLAGQDFVMIGADQKIPPFNNKETIAAHLGFSSGQKVIVIKSSPISFKSNLEIKSPGGVTGALKSEVFGYNQPFFHLDVFLTLAGKNEKNKERILVGYPVAVAPETLEIVLAVRERVQEVVSLLIKKGFEIIRNPMPLIYDDSPSGERIWYFALYNNCIVQIGHKKNKDSSTESPNKVWIPRYGTGPFKKVYEAYDLENQKIWESIGFETYLTGDYRELSKNLGSLHCSIKCIERVMQ